MDITIHYAQSLDGRIATRTGHSKWISCRKSLALAHQLRADHQAVLVGVGTVLADDPELTVRHVEGPSPIRVVADSRLRTPPRSHVLNDLARTILVTTAGSGSARLSKLRASGAQVEVVEADGNGRVSLPALIERLETIGIGSVLVEGGREIITAMLGQRLAKRLVVCIAPKIIGEGTDAVGDLGTMTMEEALTFRDFTLSKVGDDLIFDGSFGKPLPECD